MRSPLLLFHVVAFGVISLCGCSHTPTGRTSMCIPMAIDTNALTSVEGEIQRLLLKVNELEVARQQFSVYYERTDGTSKWPDILEDVPYFKETGPFGYGQYLIEREQFRKALHDRVLKLTLQLKHLRDTLGAE